MVDLIEKKRAGQALTENEINWMIQSYMKREIPDYQMSAFLMAVMFQSMTSKETTALTKAMMYSGEVIDLSGIEGIKVDKHSTGGVGDKTTLVLAPIVASLGIPIAKMSGRGLGHTGGTLDKLEAIPGLSIAMEEEAFINQVKKINLAIVGQTKKLVPADQRLYALRDVTGTVSSIPLIASSIMSKKLACGSDAILLDVKYGYGAFMKTSAQAQQLAKEMIAIGQGMGRQVKAMISSMDQPLGCAIGNMLEVREAVETLKGQGPKDLTELCLKGAATLIVMAGKANDEKSAYQMASAQIANGKAYQTFETMVDMQGGDISYLQDFSKYPQTKYQKIYYASEKGYIKEINSLMLGIASMRAGAGRARKEDRIDPLAGIVLKCKTGAFVDKNSPLLCLYANQEITKDIDDLINQAYTYSSTPVFAKPVIEMEVS